MPTISFSRYSKPTESLSFSYGSIKKTLENHGHINKDGYRHSF